MQEHLKTHFFVFVLEKFLERFIEGLGQFAVTTLLTTEFADVSISLQILNVDVDAQLLSEQLKPVVEILHNLFTALAFDLLLFCFILLLFLAFLFAFFFLLLSRIFLDCLLNLAKVILLELLCVLHCLLIVGEEVPNHLQPESS